MTRNLAVNLLAAFCAFACAAQSQAAPLSWSVDSSLSKLTLAIPDQVSNLDGTSVSVRVRNQTGAGTNWSVGNSAVLAGTLSTNYVEGGSIDFLGGLHGLNLVNSGNYRPNPAAFNSALSNSASPDGSFQNASTSPGAFGARLRAVATGIPQFDVAYLNFTNAKYDVESGVLPLSGALGTYSFAANDTTVGIKSTVLGIDSLSTLLPAVLFPDQLNTLTGLVSGNSATVGSIVPYAPLGPNGRMLTLNISNSVVIDILDQSFTTNMTGTIVAYAQVPEPGGLMLGMTATTGLLAGAMLRRGRFRGSSSSRGRPFRAKRGG